MERVEHRSLRRARNQYGNERTKHPVPCSIHKLIGNRCFLTAPGTEIISHEISNPGS